MPSRISRFDALSSVSPTLRKMQVLWPVLAIFLLATPTGAQQAQQSPQRLTRPDRPPGQQASPQAPAQNPAPGETPLTLPAGTQLPLVLIHPVDSRAMRRGDSVFAQITAPVSVGDKVVIPPGAFVQGKIEKLSRQGTRAELLMQSVSIAFPDGYVVNLSGPLEIRGGEGTAWSNPSSGAKTGAVLAPFLGSGLGTAIGAAVHTTQSSTLGDMTITSSTPKGMAIGSIAGLAAGSVVSVLLLARSHHFYVEEGAPLEMVLLHPVALPGGPGAGATGAAASQQ